MSLPLYENVLDVLASGSSWSEAREKALLEPFDYITSNPGKDMRSQLIKAFNMWLNVPDETTAQIARIVSMLHNASLL